MPSLDKFSATQIIMFGATGKTTHKHWMDVLNMPPGLKAHTSPATLWPGNNIKTQIKDMETFHITNCINMIYKSDGWRVEYLPALLRELEARKNKLK